jgi:hypothetical protein
MKNIVLFSILLGSSIGWSQLPSLDKWSLEVGFGINKAAHPYTYGYHSNTISFPTFEVGSRYMLTPVFGFGLEYGYAQIKNDQFNKDNKSKEFTTNYMRFTGTLVFNLAEALDFQTFTNRLQVNASFGAGLSSMTNDSLKMGQNKGGETMINFCFGIMPQFKLNNQWAIRVSLRSFAHMYQEKTYDLLSPNFDRGIDGFFFTGTAGVTYFLGKQEVHADWYNGKVAMMEELALQRAKYDSIVRQLEDGDKDGVPNYLDWELTSAENANVDSHGVTILVPNPTIAEFEVKYKSDFVEFPTKLGLFYTVQVGYYALNDPTNLDPAMASFTKIAQPNGDNRYVTGFYDDYEVANQVRGSLFYNNYPGAYVEAYYNGKRIGAAEAERLLKHKGKIVLERNL